MRARIWLLLGGFGILPLLLMLASFTVHHDPLDAQFVPLLSPSEDHWFGTDRLGRDVWSRWVVGGQRTLGVTYLSIGIAIGGGFVLGGIGAIGPAGIRQGGLVLIDALLAIPTLLWALVVLAAMDNGLMTIGIGVGIAYIGVYAKITRDALQVAMVQPFVEGAYSIGASRWRVFVFHITPTALPTLASFGGVIFGWALLYSAALTFLGFGGDPSQPDWGSMLAQARQNLDQAPWLAAYPGIGIAVSIGWVQSIAHRVGRLRF